MSKDDFIPNVEFLKMDIRCGSCSNPITWGFATSFGGSFNVHCNNCRNVVVSIDASVIKESELEDQ